MRLVTRALTARVSAALILMLLIVGAALPASAAKDPRLGLGQESRIRINTCGNEVDYPVRPSCNDTFFPADTPFYVEHGWTAATSPTDTSCHSMSEQAAFTLEYFLDGAKIAAFKELNFDGQCWLSTRYILSYPQGLTGTHDFQVVYHYPENLAPFPDLYPGPSLAFHSVRVVFTTP